MDSFDCLAPVDIGTFLKIINWFPLNMEKCIDIIKASDFVQFTGVNENESRRKVKTTGTHP